MELPFARRFRFGSAVGLRVTGFAGSGPQAFTPRDCPAISDRAVIVARVSSSPSGAPNTKHPGVDLDVQDGEEAYIVRVHFGDLGDGLNSCLHFEECKNTHPLPGDYPVPTPKVKRLFAYLKQRDYSVGRFTSWGMPWRHAATGGSNCGDAFLEVVGRLGIAEQVRPAMQQWIRDKGLGRWAVSAKWSFERGWRHPVDEFYQEAVFKSLPASQAVQAQPAMFKKGSRTPS